MSKFIECEIFGGSVVEKVEPTRGNKGSKKPVHKGSRTPLSSNNERVRHYWNNARRWRAKKYCLGFEGRFKSKIDIIFESSAFKNHDKIKKSKDSFVDLIRKHAGELAAICVLEYGETGLISDFPRNKSSVSPHYHCLLEKEFDRAFEKKLRNLIKRSSFESFVYENIDNEYVARSYTCKSEKKRKNGKPLKPKSDEILEKWNGIDLRCTYTHKIKNRLKSFSIKIEEDLLSLFNGNPHFKHSSFKQFRIESGVRKIGVKDIDFTKFNIFEKLFMSQNLLQALSVDGKKWSDFSRQLAVIFDKDNIDYPKLSELVVADEEAVVTMPDLQRWYYEKVRLIDDADLPTRYESGKERPLYPFKHRMFIKMARKKKSTFEEFQSCFQHIRFWNSSPDESATVPVNYHLDSIDRDDDDDELVTLRL